MLNKSIQLERITNGGPGGRAPNYWVIFEILRQKIAILTPFQLHFARF